MSFPSGTLIVSNSMPREHQGLAASLVNTVVNYSISLGLGFAGTVESRVNHSGLDVFKGYRGATYMGIGLAGLGVGIATVCHSHCVDDRVESSVSRNEDSMEGIDSYLCKRTVYIYIE